MALEVGSAPAMPTHLSSRQLRSFWRVSKLDCAPQRVFPRADSSSHRAVPGKNLGCVLWGSTPPVLGSLLATALRNPFPAGCAWVSSLIHLKEMGRKLLWELLVSCLSIWDLDSKHGFWESDVGCHLKQNYLGEVEIPPFASNYLFGVSIPLETL